MDEEKIGNRFFTFHAVQIVPSLREDHPEFGGDNGPISLPTSIELVSLQSRIGGL